MNSKATRLIVVALGSLFASLASATTDWSAQDYDLYPGDFNGDGKTDILYIAKDVTRSSGIAISDATNTPSTAWQSWPSNYLGLQWYGNRYNAVIGDYNGDGKSDVLLNSNGPGDSLILISDANGKLTSVAQSIGTCRGLVWSGDQHKVFAGRFSGRTNLVTGKPIYEFFLQSTTSSGLNAVVQTHEQTDASDVGGGQIDGCGSAGPDQSWGDSSWPGLKWSTKNTVLNAGDFNGDGLTDLLLQAKPTIVTIDYEIPIPVPFYPPNSFGVAFSLGGSAPFLATSTRLWNRTAFGVDWSPAFYNVVIGNFVGTPIMEILLQSKSATKPSYLVGRNLDNTDFAFSSNIATGGGGPSISGDSAKLFAANFDGAATAEVGLYIQSNASSGSNYFTNVIGASMSTTTHSPTSTTGIYPTTAAGRTKGIASVTATGEASYSVPIELPSGINGLTPQLAFVYNSATNTGLLGPRWDLSGLSSITRCPQTIAQNGVSNSVEMQSSDRYCLDGNQLRWMSGTYGSDESTYRTELDNFSLITAKTSSGNGPQWFEVKDKDGLIYEYGNSADSRVEVADLYWIYTSSGAHAVAAGTVRSWSLTKVSDRAGNYIQFNYTNDSGNGMTRIDSIQYTGRPGTTPAYTVKFNYGTVSSPLIEYDTTGGRMASYTYLTRVVLSYASTEVRSYNLSYLPSGNGAPLRPLLSSVQQCAQSTTDCLAPTNFQWTIPDSGWRAVDGAAFTASADARVVRTLDFNGDGFDDIIYYDPGDWHWRVVWGGPNGYSGVTDTGATNSTSEYSAKAVVIDLDGNGRKDLLIPKYDDAISGVGWSWLKYEQNGSISLTTTGVPYFEVPLIGTTTAAVDVNGDGYQDLVFVIGNSIYVNYHDANGNPTFNNIQLAWNAPAGKSIVSLSAGGLGTRNANIDIDNDGRQDLIVQLSTGYGYLFSTGAGFVTAGGQVWTSSRPIAGNFSADTCNDLLVSRYPTLNIYSPLVSHCDRNQTYASETGAYTSDKVVLIDINNDGRDDMLANSGAGWKAELISPNNLFSGWMSSANIAFPDSTAMIFSSDIDGDGQDDLTHIDASGVVRSVRHSGSVPELLLNATDGYGNFNNFSYQSLSGSHCVGVDGTAPALGSGLQRTQARKDVVCSVAASDGTGGAFSVSYSYVNPNEDIHGRGFVGFDRRTSVDSRTGISRQENYHQAFPYAGMIYYAVDKQPSGVVIREATTSVSEVLNGSGSETTHYPFIQSSTFDSHEVAPGTSVNGTLVSQQTTVVNTIDSFGNATDVTSTMTDKHTASPFNGQAQISRTVLSITNDTSTWCIGRPHQAQITTTLPDGTSRVSTQSATIDYTNCRINQSVLEPGNVYLEVKTDYVPDSCGNVYSATTTGRKHDGTAYLTPRSTTWNYGSACRFPETITTDLGTETRTYDYALGVLKTDSDPNGLQTQWFYDGHGRRTKETQADNTSTEMSLSACSAANNHCGVADLRMRIDTVERNANGTPIRTSYDYVDSMDRVRVQDDPLPLTGDLSHIVTTYDALGRVATRTAPYTSTYQGQTVFTYDLIGRQTFARLYSGNGTLLRTNSALYEATLITETDARGSSTTKRFRATGQLAYVTDPGTGGSTSYAYTFEGGAVLAAKVTDALSNVATTRTNRLGHRTQSVDPDMGTWNFEYNSLGELMRQTDAKSQPTTFTYDNLGRPLTRVETEGTTTFLYGSASDNLSTSKNIGRLKSMSKTGYSETYSYDLYGRPQTTTVNAAADGTYSLSATYDAASGFVDTITYPASTGSNPLKVKYGYSQGEQTSVRDYTGNVLGTSYWQLNAMDAMGHSVDESLGNGVRVLSGFDPTTGLMTTRQAGAAGSTTNRQNLTYSWDANGNLERRTDNNQAGLYEHFYYDPLNRLDHSTRNGTTNLSMGYDAIGNITSKSDVGSYTYPTSGAGSVRPHAVTTAGGSSYLYDNNGNMTTRPGATVSWYSDNSAKKITQGSMSSEFWYTPAGSRYKQVAVSSNGTETTLYVAGLMEKVTLASGVTSYRHYISAGNSTVIHTRLSSGTNQTYYATRDQIDSVTTITDQNGAIILNETFDPFGKRRGSNWTGNPTTADLQAVENSTRHGYTDHIQLDNVGLIHMNGRVQDPRLGRFISADPYVQAPEFSQSLNRYSYVWNNPLSANDPTGFYTMMDGVTVTGSQAGETGGALDDLLARDFEHNAPGGVSIESGANGAIGNTSTLQEVVVEARHSNKMLGPVVVTVNSFLRVKSFLTGLAAAAPGAEFQRLSIEDWQRGNYISSAVLYAGALADAAIVVGTLGESSLVNFGIKATATATRGGAAAVRAGQVGEAAVRSVYNIGDKVRFVINGRGRVPDGLNEALKTLSEVKNVDSLSFTRQLRDYLQYAQGRGFQFDLYTRPGTTFSRPLQDAIDSGLINHIPIP